MNGQDRKRFYLYKAGDPLSATWAKLSVKRRRHVTLADARRYLRNHP